MTSRPGRKLAVIVHADVVDSTVLVQMHESLAHERIQDVFNRFSRVINDFSGVAHELRGDALVAEFARASDAVCAAIAFQQANIEHNSKLDGEIKAELRIGIAMGEVVIADNTLTGGGVVMAQRLEQLAESGEICIQGAIYETVPRRMPFEYQSLGERQLKGFVEPVRAFTVKLRDGELLPAPDILEIDQSDKPLSENKGPGDSPKIRKERKSSILLTPVDTSKLSGEAFQFCAAVEETILTSLANWTGIRLVNEITEADFEVGISIQIVQKRYRTAVKFNDLGARQQFSSARFDGEYADIFESADELCFRISSAIRNNILQREAHNFKSVPLQEKTNEDLLSEAGYLSYSMNIDVQNLAQSMICRVIERDPDNFMALSMRAMGIVGLCAIDFRPMREQDGEQALAMARKARSISPNSDFANYAVSFVQLFYKHDYAAAMRSARKSLELNTGWIDPLGQVGRIEIVTGKPQQGIEKCTRTFAANPQSGTAYLHADAIAWGYFVCADYAKAIEWCRWVEEIQPDFCFSTLLLISSLSHNGENSEAASEARQFSGLHPQFSITEMWVWPFQNPADWERLKSGLRAAGLAD